MQINGNVKNTALADNALAQLQQLQGKKGEFSETEIKKLKQAAQDFESIFITQILKNMRKSVPESKLFGNDNASEFYTSLFDENIAKSISSKGGLKIADTLIKSMLNKGGDDLPKAAIADYRLSPIKMAVHKNKSGHDWDRSLIKKAAAKYKLDPNLVKAVIKVESADNPQALSKAGAAGLMQLMKETADSLGVTNRYDAEQNIFGGAKYLRQMIDRFNGNVEHALAAYNAGPQAVEKYNGIPPYSETQRYVTKVLNKYQAM